MDEAAKVGATDVTVLMDSKLVVEQMSGRWQVKHPDIVELYKRAKALASKFDRISYAWVPRERNSHADRLANEAMDAAAEAETAAVRPMTEARETAPAGGIPTPPGWTGARGAPPDCCCCATGRPSSRCTGATRAR
ncbi:reverse transcriptase-like family protein [Mycobacterium xenopi 3993]|nr:reverse transcriptase-like family protein [Mycobacterium xenopi 3993]